MGKKKGSKQKGGDGDQSEPPSTSQTPPVPPHIPGPSGDPGVDLDQFKQLNLNLQQRTAAGEGRGRKQKQGRGQPQQKGGADNKEGKPGQPQQKGGADNKEGKPGQPQQPVGAAIQEGIPELPQQLPGAWGQQKGKASSQQGRPSPQQQEHGYAGSKQNTPSPPQKQQAYGGPKQGGPSPPKQQQQAGGEPRSTEVGISPPQQATARGRGQTKGAGTPPGFPQQGRPGQPQPQQSGGGGGHQQGKPTPAQQQQQAPGGQHQQAAGGQQQQQSSPQKPQQHRPGGAWGQPQGAHSPQQQHQGPNVQQGAGEPRSTQQQGRPTQYQQQPQRGQGEQMQQYSPHSRSDMSTQQGRQTHYQQQPQRGQGEQMQQYSPHSRSDMSTQQGRQTHYQQQPQRGQGEQMRQYSPPSRSDSLSSVASSLGSIPRGQKQKQQHQIQSYKTSPLAETGPKSGSPSTKGVPSPTTAVQTKTDIEISQRIMKAGTQGRVIQLQTNHFAVKINEGKQIIHYDVAIDPDRPKKLLWEVMLSFKQAYYKNYNPAYDGRKNLYSARELPFGDEIENRVQLEFEGRPKEFNVKVKRVAVIDLGLINQYYEAVRNNRTIEVPNSSLRVLDVLLRYSLSNRFIISGSSFFHAPTVQNQPKSLGGGMDLYTGAYQSMNLGWKPYLNVDVANKAFPSAIDVISVIKQMCRNVDLNIPLRQYDLEDLTKHMRTLRVVYEIPGNRTSRRIYRVNGVVDCASNLTFTLDNGSKTTIENYFRNDRGFTLKYPNMPCLWVGSLTAERKIYVPSELCVICESQVINRKCSAEQTRNMIRHCATDTATRRNNIQKFVNEASYNRDATIREFDINISTEFERVDGRVIQPPRLAYKNGPATVRKGVWNSQIFINAVQLSQWTILNVDDRTRPNELENFASMITRESSNLGMSFPTPIRPFQSLRLNRNSRNQKMDLEKYFATKKGVDIIFVVIPDFIDNVYGSVKQASELAIGCLTQCIKAGTLSKRMNQATIGNILLKVNTKLNGLNHVLCDPPEIMRTPIMIMGADVTHPGPDNKTTPSVAAVTASHDSKAVKYNICWRLQAPTTEVIGDMQAIVHEQLSYFYSKNKRLPERIIFYRDGVSNGQFEIVLDAELKAVRRACASFGVEYKPKITFLVVQKRHHTRFFPMNPRDSEDKNCNVPAGTCVDTKITLPTWQNFFLVSHASIQGVAKPTKYVTLWDDSELSNDELQKLTYYLCHLFARCNRSVSYPAPTYYAHLAAARAKAYTDSETVNLDRLKDIQSKLAIKENIVKGMPMFFI